MPTEADPILGTWYQHLDKGQKFCVVALNEDDGLIEMQHFDGDLEEIDSDTWYQLDLEPIETLTNSEVSFRPRAILDLSLGNDWIAFNARFGGQDFHVSLPPTAVLGIYARENGRGMLFAEEEPEPEGGPPEPSPEGGPPRERTSLKVVK